MEGQRHGQLLAGAGITGEMRALLRKQSLSSSSTSPQFSCAPGRDRLVPSLGSLTISWLGVQGTSSRETISLSFPKECDFLEEGNW